MTARPTCGAAGGRRRDGGACGVFLRLSPVNGLCIQHDPLRADERAALWSSGARAQNEVRRRAQAAKPANVPRPPRDLAEAQVYASWAVNAAAVGEISVNVAREITNGLRVFILATEKTALAADIRKLRAEIAALRKAEK